MAELAAATLISEARRRSGISQKELADRSGVVQSVISAYESGGRQPSLPTLQRLVEAAGFDLRMKLDSGQNAPRLKGILGARLTFLRDDVQRIAKKYGVSNVRVFGSVSRGEERRDSDIDLLVDIAPNVGLFGLARCRRELEQLLNAHVELIPSEGLKPGIADEIIAEARQI